MSGGHRRPRARRAALTGALVLSGLLGVSGCGSAASDRQSASNASSAAPSASSAASHEAAPSAPATSAPSTSAPSSRRASSATAASPRSSGSSRPRESAAARSSGSALTSGSSSVGSGSGSGSGSAARPFAADSPWNTPIPEGAPLDPDSSAVVRDVLDDPDLVMNVETYSYAIPFYVATASTPRVRLLGRADHGATVPIDPSWRPNEGGDHKMNVLDPATGLVYELQGYGPATRSAYWMVVRDYVDGLGDGRPSDGRRGPSGAGVSQAAGVIRIADVRRGRIDHALAFVTSAPLAGRFRYPATSTDGTSQAASGVEEGMRVQLDPALDLDSIHGMSKAERMIARALQRYGAFCVDNGGGNNQALGFYAEQPTAATGDPYAAAGLRGDWVQLPHIPRDALRVVAASVTAP